MYIYYHYYYEMRRLDQMRRPRGPCFTSDVSLGEPFFLTRRRSGLATSLGMLNIRPH